MTDEPSHPLQKLVRSVIRDLVDQVNSQKADNATQQKKSKPATAKSQSNLKQKQRSRYISASVRVSVLHRDRYRCVFCGRSSRQVQLEVDHIVPFSKGGSHNLSNLQTLCFDCNRGKGTRRLK